MRIEIEKLFEQLGVDRVLYPYETQPWFYYDDKQGITCSAEVRMGPDGEDIEAEVQLVRDDTDVDEEPPPPPPPSYTEDKKTGDEKEEEDEGNGGKFWGGPQQLVFLRAEPAGNKEWTVKYLRVKGKDFVNRFHDWETKSCELFTLCVQCINMEEIPDVDPLIKKYEEEKEKGGRGKRGRIGRKSPKMNAGVKVKP